MNEVPGTEPETEIEQLQHHLESCDAVLDRIKELANSCISSNPELWRELMNVHADLGMNMPLFWTERDESDDAPDA